MTRRRTIALTAVAALAVPLLPTPAAAGENSTYLGGCVLAAAGSRSVNLIAPDTYEGVLAAAVVVYSTANPEDNPVTATARCYVTVDDREVASMSATGTTVVAGAGRVTFEAPRTSDVELCTEVDYLSDETPTSVLCDDVLWLDVPPQEVADLGNDVTRTVYDVVTDVVDPLVCEVLRLVQLPGYAETRGGDFYVLDGKVWDCPPYDYPYEADAFGVWYTVIVGTSLVVT